jgi:hypothetical protein
MMAQLSWLKSSIPCMFATNVSTSRFSNQTSCYENRTQSLQATSIGGVGIATSMKHFDPAAILSIR